MDNNNTSNLHVTAMTSTTTSSSTSVADFDRFELMCLKGSPYSERIRWVLQLLHVDDYALLKHETCRGELYLRYKVNRWNPWHRVTVPVAWVSYPPKVNNDAQQKQQQPKLLILEDGLDIIEWANDVAHQRNPLASNIGNNNNNSISSSNHQDSSTVVLTLIPTLQILDYCNIADETMEYLRGLFLEKCRQNPHLIKNFMEQDKVPPDFSLP